MDPTSKALVGSTGTYFTLENPLASKVATFVMIGTSSFLAVAWAPLMWSPCSWVMSMDFIIEESTPAWSISDMILLQLRPQSIMMASPSHSITEQLPSLPLASTWTSSMFRPFSCRERR